MAREITRVITKRDLERIERLEQTMEKLKRMMEELKRMTQRLVEQLPESARLRVVGEDTTPER